MKRLLKDLFTHYGWTLGFVCILIILSTLSTLAMTLFTKTLIDRYILPMMDQAAPDFSPLAIALAKLAAVLLAGTVATFLYNFLMIKVEQGTIRRIRCQTFDRLQDLPLSYFDSHPHGEIMSVFTNDIDTFRQMVGRTIPQIFSALVTLVSTLVSMIVLSLPLTLMSIVLTGISMYISVKLAMQSRKYFKSRQENLAKVNGYIEEMVSGQKVVKVFNHEEKVKEDFSGINYGLFQSVFNANKVANIIMPVNNSMANLGYVIIAIAGAVIAINSGYSALTVGTLVSFLTLHKNFTRPFAHLSHEVNNIAMADAGAERVYAIAEETPEADEGKVTLVQEGDGEWSWDDGGKRNKLEGLVSLEKVSFAYVPGKEVLHDISLTAYPGQKIALVGETGSGKTTITNLITRFYEIEEGRISYDGHNVKDIAKPSLRHGLGIVLQETDLFTGTVMENLRFGRPDATDEECKAAARLVHADSFIRRLPQGYDTVIASEGGLLSEGERQLLSIARTAVENPPVLILDEATSSIDTRTEQMIQKGMDGIMRGRTSFVIAHRLSTVKSADYIIVLDKGRIIEAGKHQELLEQKGRYYKLYTGGSVK